MRSKSDTNCDIYLTENIFKTYSSLKGISLVPSSIIFAMREES